MLKNNAAAGKHWLGLKLAGKTANRDAIGARVIWEAGGVRRSRLKTSGGSFLSFHDPRMVLGLDDATIVTRLEVHWPLPSTCVGVYKNLPVDRYLTITEGEDLR